MTKKEQGFVNNYNSSIERYGIRTIYDVYAKCGTTNRRAWQAIVEECNYNNGHCLTVVSHSPMQFTAAYYITDPKTEKSALIYHTLMHKYIIQID